MPDKKTEGRPPIEEIRSSEELQRWYWLKSELEAEARRNKIRLSGGKFTILNRLCHFLDTGDRIWPGDKRRQIKSKFDWHCEPLTTETVITDSYKNTQNVRRFFKEHAGQSFKFNIEFMAWMKANEGKTLAEAVVEYQEMRQREKQPGHASVIAPHNQFNQYTRDFLKDNPDMGMEEVRKYWALKRALPSETGLHVYEPSDLKLT